jgi:putative PIN family toxin of toxin-antitoxin system
LITEFEAVITRSKFRRILAVSDLSPVWLMTELRSLVEIVDSPTLNALVSRDPDDDAVLAAAVAAKADIIVSGDADLLILGGYADIPIMTPAQALAIIGPEFP